MRGLICRFSFSLILVWGLLICPSQGASVLDFPRLSAEPGNITGLAIANPTSENAQVVVTAFSGLEGENLGTAEISVPAGQQVGRLTSEIFPGLDPSTVGWLQAFSTTNGLTGFFLFLNAGVTEFDGAELPRRARSIIFNQVRVGGTFSTELNIVNPTGAATTVELVLRGGTSPIERSIDLPAQGSVRVDAATLFDVTSVADGAYVQASASQDILGFEFVRNTNDDLIGLNAKPAAELLNTLYFPQLAVLGPFTSQLGVVNYSNQSLILTITAHKADGSLFTAETRQNPVIRALGPRESLREDIAELFGFQGTAALEGWLEVKSTSEAVNGYISYQTPATGASAAVAAVSQGSSQAIFSHIATTFGFFTGVAALNTASLPANVRFLALTQSGQVLGSFNTVLQPGQRISRLISDVIPAADGQAGGIILVRSAVPVFLTSLFGTNQGTVLANIPPQDAPQTFAPDAGQPTPLVAPPLAVVQPNGVQNFRVTGLGGNVEWKVNGVTGGGGVTGTIDNTGRYQAPAAVPNGLPVTVTAEAGSSVTGAAVDVLLRDVLIRNLGIVQSVAYLGGLQRLYSAELFAAGAANVGARLALSPEQAASSTGIFEISPPNNRVSVVDFGGEVVSKMISFRARNNREFLLLAGRTTGRIIRLDPTNGQFTNVVTGLNSPSALVFDPVTGNLLVAEANQVTTIPRDQLEADLTPAATDRPTLPKEKRAVVTPVENIGGIAVDNCTGNIYLSNTAEGTILEFIRSSGQVRTVATGLQSPGQLLGIYRTGVSCPVSFHLLVTEQTGNQISLVVPSGMLIISPWAVTENARDIIVLPAESPFVASNAILVAELLNSQSGQISFIDILNLYEQQAINPPVIEVSDNATSPPGPDLAISSTTGQAGSTSTVNLFFRPGPSNGQPGGPDEITAIVVSIDYDESRLSFDPTDSNQDGIPDSLIPGVSSNFTVTVLFDPEDTDGEIDIVIADLETPLSSLPEGNIISITFTNNAASSGTADIRFSMSPAPSMADVLGNGQAVDELANGTITIEP